MFPHPEENMTPSQVKKDPQELSVWTQGTIMAKQK
jgi:hypothetical protein